MTRAVNAPVIGGQLRAAPRLAPIVVPVTIGGVAVSAAAVMSIATSELVLRTAIGALILLVAAVIAEANPVRVEGVSAGGVSLAAAFLVGAALLFDWEVATLLGLLTRAAIELAQRRPFVRLAYNSATYALASAAAGIVVHYIGPHETAGRLVVATVLASLAFYVVNVALVGAVVARASATSVGAVMIQSARWTAIPFALMGSISLILAVLWLRSPILIVALVGPLLAVALYQRSVFGELEALRLAKTDPLTGLGNHRAFHERLGQEIERYPATSVTSLCLIDVDEFKRVNDRLGHQVGDLLLAAVARVMPEVGEAYRIGGDEFAIMITGPSETSIRALTRLRERVAALEVPGVDVVTLSIGVATFGEHAKTADDLFNAADTALYQAKRHGKNRVQTVDLEVAKLASEAEIADGPGLVEPAESKTELIAVAI